MISLTPVQSLLACCLVLVAGRILTTRIGVLSRYSIPDPIVGGLLFAVLATALDTWGGIQISLETNIKPTLLLIFFGCIGLTADLKLLARGGPRLIAFLLALIPFLVLQNAVGLGLAWLLDMHPLMGLIGGTITLVGGHGTGAAYAARFADINNIQDVMALAMTAATSAASSAARWPNG
ncbi:sodium/glutamate symport carrier protein [Bordetella pertussis]|nr:sodium/glutamate symport carrier protein [Bordetella pertussis]